MSVFTYSRDLLLQELARDEGVRSKPYVDTVGKTSIGIGRNLSDRGLRPDEINYLACNDIDSAEADLDRNVPWWRKLSDARQRALLNMCFNMGWPRLAGFKAMWAALQDGDFVTAAVESLDSKWADQLDGKLDGKNGERAIRIAKMIKEG